MPYAPRRFTEIETSTPRSCPRSCTTLILRDFRIPVLRREDEPDHRARFGSSYSRNDLFVVSWIRHGSPPAHLEPELHQVGRFSGRIRRLCW